MMWTRELMAKQVQNGCTCGGCGIQGWHQMDCVGCGFHEIEVRRRKRLPLVQLENGLLGKYVGRTKVYPPAKL